MASEQRVVPLALMLPSSFGWIISLYYWHEIEHMSSNEETCYVVIDGVMSCRIESKTLSTPQLSISDMPEEVQLIVNELIGKTYRFDRAWVESGILIYIFSS